MNKYHVGIIGLGVVGKGIEKLLKTDVIAIYDPATEYKDKDAFKECDLIVISVPTPYVDGVGCDTRIVESSLSWAFEINKEAVYLIKSAVVPSEVLRFKYQFNGIRLVVSPEYMGESKYFTPEWKYPHPERMESHTWQVYGGEKKDTSFVVDCFKRRMGVDTQHIQTTLMTASLCKYIENTFFATKVTFSNEVYDLANLYGVDYNELRECWLADPRVNRNHTLVFPESRGYGGKCFPKDLKALIKDAEGRGYSADLLKAVDRANEKFTGYNNETAHTE
jgi:UDPglucose 6-dehydrogenase